MTPRTRHGDAGSLSLSAAIVVPGIILILAVAIMAGRIALAKGQVESAANEAARTASIARTTTDADNAARSTVTTILGDTAQGCTTTTDLTGFTAPLGQVGHVTITVTCTAPLASLPILNLGDSPITRTATSVVDPYRSR